MNTDLQNILNDYCLILRKYQLLTKKEFFKKFKGIDIELLQNSWDYSFKKIQNREIIKDTTVLPKHGKREIKKRINLEFPKQYTNQISDLYYYLNSNFDVKELKLDKERIERRFRNILAKRHQKLLEKKIFSIKRKDKFNAIIINVKNGIVVSIIPLLIVGFLFGARIRDGFTSVDTLTERIYERSVYKFTGSKCRDGTLSHSQGRGTCSWHGGVRFKFYKGDHKKSRNQCRIEAKEKSWID